MILARDMPSDVVRAHVRSGSWNRVRRGAYLPAESSAYLLSDEPEDRILTHRAQVAAVAAQAVRHPVFSHDSAALLWGAQLWRRPTAVHVTQKVASGRASPGVVRHRLNLEADDVASRSGLRVTSPVRTLVQCVLSGSPLARLVAADSLLRCGADHAAATLDVAAMRGVNGLRLARWALGVADAGAESPGETLTRYVLLAHGFPTPESQVVVETSRGRCWADLGWPQWRVLVEFDGMVKYRQLAGGDPSSVVVAEKRRQEALEDADFRVVRVTFADLFAPERFLRRVAQLLPPEAVGDIAPNREFILPASFR